jgi:hypothetical protein
MEDGYFILKIEIPEKATAKVVLPYDIKSANLKVINQANKKPVKVKIENGGFNMNSGRFEIRAIQ